MSKDDHWPPRLLTKNDKLFDMDKIHTSLNACVGDQLPFWDAPSWYAGGFRAAARHLAESVIERPNHQELYVDTTIYPILFLYRHHLELQLKRIINTAHAALGVRKVAPGTHDLGTLWGIARPMIEQVCPDEAEWSQNRHVTRLLREYCTNDPRAEFARYPKTSKDLKSFKGTKLISLRIFFDVVERLCDYLDAVADMVDYASEVS